MKSILNYVGSNFMQDHRFEVSNNRRIILVVGLTGSGKSSFINFMTNKDLCEVSDNASSCTKNYKMVDLYYDSKVYYFVDTPGLDDAEGDKNNIEEIIKFRNTVPRINTIIYCQNLTVPRFDKSTKTLFELIKQLYQDFSHLIIVRTNSDRSSDQFENNKKKCINSICHKLKEYSLLDEKIETIPEYYIDSVRKDKESIEEKNNLLDKLRKMDPIFKSVNEKIINQVELYDSVKNIIVIKESKEYEYIDFDGAKRVSLDTSTEIIDLNEITDVEVNNIDMNKSWGICCCKKWKIIYQIFYLNKNNEKRMIKEIELWQDIRDEDKSNEIRNEEKRNLI